MESEFPCDQLETTFHLGARFKDVLCGIATFFPEDSGKIDSENPYRLRGMAVDPQFHRQGIGRKILTKGLEILRDRNVDLLWFNAREEAFEFYESMGFAFATKMFVIPDVGPHKVMYRRLQATASRPNN